MDLQANPVATYLHTRPREVKPRPAKPVGRPLKRTPEHLAKVLRGYQQMREWFISEVGRPPRSDIECLTVYRAHVQDALGEAMSEAQETKFQQGLKTALNVLGQARRLFSEHPGNPPIYGVDGSPGT